MESRSNDLSSQIWAKLFPNLWAFLVQFLAFLVLLVIVFRFGYKPVKKLINKRKELLENEVKETNENNLKSKEILLKNEKEIANAKVEAEKIIKKAEISAQNKANEKIIEAEAEANEIKEKATVEATRIKQEATKSIKNDIVEVALDASKAILGREINEDDSKKIVNDFIDNLDNE